MSQNLIHGRLKIPPADYTWDLQFAKQHFTLVSEPQLKKELNDEKCKFWSVDFTAAPEEWRAVAPDLAKMGIEANLYDAMPELYFQAKAEQERTLARIGEGSKRRLVLTAGAALSSLGVAGFIVLQSYVISFALIVIGVLISTVGTFLVERFNERVRQEQGGGLPDRAHNQMRSKYD